LGTGDTVPRILELGRFTPREDTSGIRCTVGWVSTRADLDAVVKRKILSLPLLEIRNPVVHHMV
jgi:hypothetical protein